MANNCRSTHHKLAMEALRFLRGQDVVRWRNLFLKHHAGYLEGSKAPDTQFKDFRNHVLHVSQGNWGGAIKTSRKWYGITVDSFRKQDWDYGVYAAGVLSHYYTDPIMPFHTAQSQKETNIHRAVEWSVAKSYDELSDLARELGYPEIEPAAADDWLEQMVIDGAELSHQYYDQLIEHYDFKRGVSDPPAGLDDESRQFLAGLLSHAAVGVARILERAFEDASVQPPLTDPTLRGYLAALQVPIYWVLRKMSDARERDIVEEMYEELQETGKVERSLPEDDRTIQRLYVKEVGSESRAVSAVKDAVTKPEPPAGKSKSVSNDSDPFEAAEGPACTAAVERSPRQELSAFVGLEDDQRSTERRPVSSSLNEPVEVASREVSTSLKFRLEPSDDIVDAPSIGSKTAKRLRKVDIHTVRDLLDAEPADLADRLGVRYIDAAMISDWQAQATLCCRIPELRGHDAQILVACKFRSPDKIASSNPEALFSVVGSFVGTSKGERIVRGGQPPDLAEVADWIEWARQARPLRAA
ncbi:MAG: DUF4332 domain-containing protein [Planctomycetota bacterium]|nr:DUF4332 domain-containing protein [Planctomycetota bacterium]